jgi:hypothetical protein
MVAMEKERRDKVISGVLVVVFSVLTILAAGVPAYEMFSGMMNHFEEVQPSR